jgi:hypothetical protein
MQLGYNPGHFGYPRWTYPNMPLTALAVRQEAAVWLQDEVWE